MLWFAGFLGLMAIGTVTMVDFNATDEAEDTDDTPVDAPAPFLLSPEFLSPVAETPALTTDIPEEENISEDPASFFANATADVLPEAYEDEDESSAFNMATLGDTDIPDTVDIIAFDPTQDGLMVVWDDSLGHPPEIELSENPDDPWVTDIRLNDDTIAHVRADDAVTPEHVSLVPLSTAEQFGWAAA